MPNSPQPGRPTPPNDPNRASHLFPENPTIPTAERRPILTPEEQVNAVVSQYCKQHRLLMCSEKGRHAAAAKYLPGITRDLLGPEKDPRDPREDDEPADAWKHGGSSSSCKTNELYDSHVVEIVAAAHDCDGCDHLFVTITKDYRSFIIPNAHESGGEPVWDVKEPLFVSQGQFCGLHVLVQPLVNAQGHMHPHASYCAVLPAGLVNQEIQKTIDNTSDTLITNMVHHSARQLLPSLQTTERVQTTTPLEILTGTQSGPGRCEALGFTPSAEAIVVVGTQTDEIYFEPKAEVPFSSTSAGVFESGSLHGDTTVPDISKLHSHLFRHSGAQRPIDAESERVRFIRDIVHRKLLRRFDPRKELAGLTFSVESALVSSEDRTGVLCVSFRDLDGLYYAPNESGTLQPSREPLLLVVTPELTQKVRRTGVRRDVSIQGVPWMLEAGRTRVVSSPTTVFARVTLNGLVCSEQAFCKEMVRLTECPTESILYSGLLDRVRNQLRRAENPVSPLNPEIVGISGKTSEQSLLEVGYALLRHRFGYSFLLINRDSESGFVEFQRAAATDALFLEQRR